jgi:hypothetical protein
MAEEDEPDDDGRDPLVDLFGVDEEDERPHDAPTWLGGFSQMAAAVLIVIAVIVAFVVAAILFRRLWP